MKDESLFHHNVTIESAYPADLAAILSLLAENGLPQAGLQDHLETALVARAAQGVVGSAALELYGSAALLRSVAVAEPCRGRGLGQQLTQAALTLARQRRVTAVYLLTETAGDFFPRLGFKPVERNRVPDEVRGSLEFTTLCPDSALAMGRAIKAT